MRRLSMAGAAALAAVVAFLPVGSSAAGATSVKLSPSSGPNGTKVTVSGDCGSTSRFFYVQVDAKVGGTTIDSRGANVGSAGAFSFTLTMRKASTPSVPAAGSKVTVTVSCVDYATSVSHLTATFSVTGRPAVAVPVAKLNAVGAKVSVPVRCRAGACAGRVTLKKGSKVLAAASYATGAGTTAKVRLKPTKAGKKILGKASKSRPVRATVTVTTAYGAPATRSVRIV